MKSIAAWILVLCLMCSCSRKAAWSVSNKYAPEVLQKDYDIYQNILEEAHPSLYWYTTKDSISRYLAWGRQQLRDSMTEPQFRMVLNYVTAKINCGHTSVRPSKRYSRWADTSTVYYMFPLSFKLWDDTAVVAANLNRRDSVLTRGTVVTAINDRPMRSLTDTLFQFISTDGYNTTHKYQALSNRGYFGSLYTSLYGWQRQFKIDYIDSLGRGSTVNIRPYLPLFDTASRRPPRPEPPRRTLPKPSRKDIRNMRRNAVRLLKIDSTSKVAMMDLNSFGRGYGLKGFFRRSFRALQKNDIGHLIIDVRGNGGGSVTNSTLLTRYISDHKFKVADSLYAVKKKKTYSRYIQNDFFNRLFITFFAGRKKDGLYHFRYFERHRFTPKRKNHFDGKVYILTGGNSFSATTLFASAVIDQENVVVVGEETGGGAYGNSAWLIPDVTLPGTRVRFRLPLFRLVINKDYPKTGRGVQPEVMSVPTVEAIKKGADYKLEKAMELIRTDK